jgi:hypothetical protein
VATAQLLPNERYALVGKTRSGKTALAMVLGSTFAQALAVSDPRWQVWWIDTKHDPKDLASLRQWGFRNGANEADQDTYGALGNAFYYRVPGKSKDGHDIDTVDYAQALLAAAYKRRHVLIIVDEYVQIVPSQREAGKALKDIFQRGGGLEVGLIGLTQEPVYVPRQLLSQASHLVLMSLTYQRDVEYVKKMIPIYTTPNKAGDRYGFYWIHTDGDGEVAYYHNQREWYSQLNVALPNGQPVALPEPA